MFRCVHVTKRRVVRCALRVRPGNLASSIVPFSFSKKSQDVSDHARRTRRDYLTVDISDFRKIRLILLKIFLTMKRAVTKMLVVISLTSHVLERTAFKKGLNRSERQIEQCKRLSKVASGSNTYLNYFIREECYYFISLYYKNITYESVVFYN